jgi:hypothetical protein
MIRSIGWQLAPMNDPSAVTSPPGMHFVLVLSQQSNLMKQDNQFYFQNRWVRSSDESGHARGELRGRHRCQHAQHSVMMLLCELVAG